MTPYPVAPDADYINIEKVNSPGHYNQGSIETIDYLKSTLTKEEFAGFCKGNVLKYVSREAHKNGIEDLKKAQWYLNRLIQISEEETAKSTKNKHENKITVSSLLFFCVYGLI